MTSNLQFDWDVLDRYFSGEASPDDIEEVQRLIARSGGDEMVRSVREIWDAAGVVQTPITPDVDAAWRRVSERIASEPATVLRFRRESRPSLRSAHKWNARRIWPGALAAVAAAALAVSLLNNVIDARQSQRRAAMSQAPERIFATRKAQRADIYLSDGTRVMLNVDSKLSVPADFGLSGRNVRLEGEAYFDVVHDETRSFRVHTALGIAEDAGTIFVVRSYPESNAIQVGVASGVVHLQSDTSSRKLATLEKGDIARLTGAGALDVQRRANIENEMAWTAGRLVFDRAPLNEVIPRMARWFDADIRLGDSALARVKYTASFSNEPVAQVLELMAASLNARVERNGAGSYVLRILRPNTRSVR